MKIRVAGNDNNGEEAILISNTLLQVKKEFQVKAEWPQAIAKTKDIASHVYEEVMKGKHLMRKAVGCS